MAIGARSQSARTYLEKHLSELLSCDLDELIKHGLRALRDTLPNEVDLSIKVKEFIFLIDNLIYNIYIVLNNVLVIIYVLLLQNVSIAVVGKGTDFTIFDENAISVYLSQIEDDKRGRPTEPDVEQDSRPPQPPPSDEGPQDPQPAVAMDTD